MPARTTGLLSAGQVARDLGVSLTTVRRMAKSGELATVKIGRAVRFEPEAIRQFIEAQRVAQAGEQ